MMKYVRRFLEFCLPVLWLIVVGTIVHEAGHIIASFLLDVPIFSIKIAPGLQIYPHFKITELTGTGFQVHMFYDTQHKHGLVGISGCLATAGVSLLFSTLCVLFGKIRQNRLCRWTSFFYLDITFYTFFTLFGLRHWLIFGSSVKEPWIAAINLHIHPFNLAIFVMSIFISNSSLILFMYKHKKMDLSLIY